MTGHGLNTIRPHFPSAIVFRKKHTETVIILADFISNLSKLLKFAATRCAKWQRNGSISLFIVKTFAENIVRVSGKDIIQEPQVKLTVCSECTIENE